jgi:uncharacterized protein (DUF1800 family)
MLTDREKIAHLYRRFSFGGSISEIDEGVSLGLEKTIQKLVDYDSVPSNFSVHPYEFAWKDKEEAEVGIWRFRLWWVLGMAASKRPLQEKLTLFWHSHFAVSDAKVENACLMLEYLQDIRSRANGKFADLTKSMAKSPAMMRYLDMERAFRGRPNENFAREVMELFTMGIGNYGERDIQEAARALTGWGMMDTFWEGGKDQTERLMTLYRDKRPAGAFCLFPAMRDSGPKTILGVTKDFDGESLVDFLCARPETAKFITKKLWEFFAYPDPEPKVQQRLAEVFIKSGGDIKKVMFAIARSPEFYSEKCVRKHYKSPADFVVGVTRQMELGEPLLQLRGKEANPSKPINKVLVDQVAAMTYYMYQQGLNLCYPDDVSGWKWGKAWISPATMPHRMQFHGLMIWNDKGPWVAPETTMNLMAKVAPKTPEQARDQFKNIFDVRLSENADAALLKLFTDNGAESYKNKAQWAGVLYNGLRILAAAPEMHVC